MIDISEYIQTVLITYVIYIVSCLWIKEKIRLSFFILFAINWYIFKTIVLLIMNHYQG